AGAPPQDGRARVHIGATLPAGWQPSDVAWLHCTQAGVDGLVGGEAGWPADTLLTRTVGKMGRRIAEYVLGWMLVETQQALAFAHPCKGACFVNVGRGATVDQKAIRSALETGRLRRAVLDVLPQEPPAADAEWWSLPNTTITPHVAGVTADEDILVDFARCRE